MKDIDLEPLLVLLITANNGELSVTNANFVGILASICYKSSENPEFWKITIPLQDEIAKNSLQAIVILGSFAKRYGMGFLQQLQVPIPILIRSNDQSKFPFILQCFRRILKNTKTSLRALTSDINDYVILCLSSQNIETKIEAVKTIPATLELRQYTYKQLLNSMDTLFSLPSRRLRYALAKTLSKILYFAGTQPYIGPSKTPINDPKKIYKIFFNTILQYAQIERNIPLLCHTMMIWIRFIPPTELTKKIHLFVKFSLAIVPFGIPLVRSCIFSRSVFRSLTSVIGNTYEPLICHYMYEESRKAGFTSINTMMTLDTLINFRASTKTITKAAKTFYPLLATADREIVRTILSFFVILGRREPKASQILVDSFISWLTTDDARPAEINGFARGISILIMTSDINDDSMEKIYEICRKWLNESIDVTDIKFSSALLLCAAAFKRSNTNFPMQLILVSFRALQRLFKGGEKIADHNDKLLTPMKFGAVLIKQIIMSNSETLPSLYPTIQQCAISIAHNSAVLSAPTLLSLWMSIKNCKPAWHISLPQTMMNATPTILARFFSPDENKTDYMMRQSTDEVDISEFLYGTNLPKQYISLVTEKTESIYTLLIADVRTPIRDELVNVVLRDYCAWAVLSAHPLKKTLLSQLFSTYEENDPTLFLLRLTLVRSIIARPHIATFIRPDALRVLFSFNPKDIRTIRVLGAAIAAYVNINPDKLENLMEFIENPKVNGPLVSAVISELKFPEDHRLEAVRCMLALERLMLSDPHPLNVFALHSLIENGLIDKEFMAQTLSIIEQFLYSDAMMLPENANYIFDCIRDITNENDAVRQNFARVFCRLPFNKTFMMTKGLRLMSHNQFCPPDRKGYSLERPRALLSAHAKFYNTLNGIVPFLNVIQQGYLFDDAMENLYQLFMINRNISFWLKIMDKVILEGSVPFDKLHGKISPSNQVLKALMFVATRIIYEKSNSKDVYDSLISYALEILKLKDTSAHIYAIGMLTEFIRFNIGKNSIEKYVLELKNIFDKSFDNAKKIESQCKFALVFHSYLLSTNSEYLDEATGKFILGINSISNLSMTLFARIAGSLMQSMNRLINDISAQFVEFVDSFMVDVCKQTKNIAELGEEAKDVFDIFYRIKRNTALDWPFLIILVREMKINGVDRSYLDLLSFLMMRQEVTTEFIDYAVSVVYHSYYYKSMRHNILDLSSRGAAVANFLSACSSKLDEKNEKTFDNILSMALTNSMAEAAVARLLKISTPQKLHKIIFTVISFYIPHYSKKFLAVIDFIAPRLSVQAIDIIISHVVRFRMDAEKKFTILMKLFMFAGNYNMMCLEDVSRLVSFFFAKGGIEFLGNMLANTDTVVYGLNFIRLGVGDMIFGMIHKINILHKVIDLLLLATFQIRKILPNEHWEFRIAHFALNYLTIVKKDDKDVISHIIQLLLVADRNILASLLDRHPKLVLLIDILTPQK